MISKVMSIFMMAILAGCSVMKQQKTTDLIMMPKRESDTCLTVSPELRYLMKYQGKNFFKRDGKCLKEKLSIEQILNRHASVVKVIYEDGKKYSVMSDGVKKGMKRVAQELFVYTKIKNKRKLIDKALSDAIFKDKAGIIVVWGGKSFIRRIKLWQSRLKLSVLYIGNKSKTRKNFFKVFPNQDNYSGKLVREMKEKGIKRVAILTPNHYEKSLFLKSIKDSFRKNGLEVVWDVMYDSHDYSSMNYACRTIFDINKEKRWKEYRSIMEKEREKAKEAGFKLNEKTVFLPAITNYDAIFIPDNFKIVNHFVKLFEYYQMPQILLVGTHEWRSHDLTKVQSKYLNGAIFVDFIGDSQQLPGPSGEKEMRPSENLDLSTDFQLMGYYSSRLALAALKASKNQRYIVGKVLKKMRIKDKFFRNRPAFKKDNQLNWPSFAFKIKGNEIIQGHH